MDSHGRQKTVRQILELTKDPEVLSIARATLSIEAAKPSNPKPEKISRKDWILYLLGIPVAIAIFLAPRTPLSAIVGFVFIFLCSWPAVLHFSGKRKWKLINSSVLVLVNALLGVIVFHWLVEERNAAIYKNLRPSAFLLNPENVRSTVFGVINDNDVKIISNRIYCYVNEAFNDNPAKEFTYDTTQIIEKPVIVNPGSDVRLTQCFKLAVSDPLTCADVTVPMVYQVAQFPHSEGIIKFRFFMNKYKAQYQWTRVGEGTPTGLCGGAPLPPEALKQLPGPF